MCAAWRRRGGGRICRHTRTTRSWCRKVCDAEYISTRISAPGVRGLARAKYFSELPSASFYNRTFANIYTPEVCLYGPKHSPAISALSKSIKRNPHVLEPSTKNKSLLRLSSEKKKYISFSNIAATRNGSAHRALGCARIVFVVVQSNGYF